MNSRFSQHQQTALQGMSIVPFVAVTLFADECCSKLCQVAEMSHSDLPSPDFLNSELHCWHVKWYQHLTEHGENSLPSTIAETLRYVSTMYLNIRALVCTLCTLPATTYSSERSFSSLKRVKMSSRSTMTTDIGSQGLLFSMSIVIFQLISQRQLMSFVDTIQGD